VERITQKLLYFIFTVIIILLALLFTACPPPTDPVTMKTMRFDSDKILIVELTDGDLQISFVDQVDGEVTVTTTVDGTDKTVWENSIHTARLDITAAGQGYVEFKAVSYTDESIAKVNATYNID